MFPKCETGAWKMAQMKPNSCDFSQSIVQRVSCMQWRCKCHFSDSARVCVCVFNQLWIRVCVSIESCALCVCLCVYFKLKQHAFTPATESTAQEIENTAVRFSAQSVSDQTANFHFRSDHITSVCSLSLTNNIYKSPWTARSATAGSVPLTSAAFHP